MRILNEIIRNAIAEAIDMADLANAIHAQVGEHINYEDVANEILSYHVNVTDIAADVLADQL